jgi:hypothetical protein
MREVNSGTGSRRRLRLHLATRAPWPRRESRNCPHANDPAPNQIEPLPRSTANGQLSATRGAAMAAAQVSTKNGLAHGPGSRTESRCAWSLSHMKRTQTAHDPVRVSTERSLTKPHNVSKGPALLPLLTAPPLRSCITHACCDSPSLLPQSPTHGRQPLARPTLAAASRRACARVTTPPLAASAGASLPAPPWLPAPSTSCTCACAWLASGSACACAWLATRDEIREEISGCPPSAGAARQPSLLRPYNRLGTCMHDSRGTDQVARSASNQQSQRSPFDVVSRGTAQRGVRLGSQGPPAHWGCRLPQRCRPASGSAFGESGASGDPPRTPQSLRPRINAQTQLAQLDTPQDPHPFRATSSRGPTSRERRCHTCMLAAGEAARLACCCSAPCSSGCAIRATSAATTWLCESEVQKACRSSGCHVAWGPKTAQDMSLNCAMMGALQARGRRCLRKLRLKDTEASGHLGRRRSGEPGRTRGAASSPARRRCVWACACRHGHAARTHTHLQARQALAHVLVLLTRQPRVLRAAHHVQPGAQLLAQRPVPWLRQLPELVVR